MLTAEDTVFLLDVDNTLLDNDRFAAAVRARLEQAFGAAQSLRYWALYADLREKLGYADYCRRSTGSPLCSYASDTTPEKRPIG